MRIFLWLFWICCFGNLQTNAQNSISLPAFTGYAIPSEYEEGTLFKEGVGVTNWTDLRQELQYFFKLRHTGNLDLSLVLKNNTAGSVLELTIAQKRFKIEVPQQNNFQKIKVGNVLISDTGFYEIRIKGLRKKGAFIADIASIELSGNASENMHWNNKSRRNAASVHLRYPLADSMKNISFYNEMMIPDGADFLHSYYMSNGFTRGYFGLQVNSETERRVIFSIWDAGTEAINRTNVADSNRVQLLAKGADVFTDDFGNEGTGGHSHWVYPWRTGTTYKFYVTAMPDTLKHTTIYSAYFFLPDQKKWKFIASYKSPKDGAYLKNLYSFNENFDGINGQLERQAYFGNQWVQQENGNWVELTKAKFSTDLTGRMNDRIDYGAGVEGGMFYLWNGGFKSADAIPGAIFIRPEKQIKPNIDLLKNIDSAYQSKIDEQLIFKAIQDKRIDTMGNSGGVYFNILKKGTGEKVSLNDTIRVFYKGTILENGIQFDKAEEKSVSFPLNRLIKGWQRGLTGVNVGSKIQLIIPSGLAYGIKNRSSVITPNSILVFDIEVIDLKHPNINQ